MNQREKILSNKSSNNTRLRSSNQSIEKEPDNLKPSAQKPSSRPPQPNQEKLEAIRGRYGIRLPSKYGKDIVEKALEKREEYRKKTPSDDMDLSGQYITYIISLFFANYFYIFYILHRGQLSEFSKRII